MKSSVFHYPYAVVFENTERALSRLGLKVISADSSNGTILAESSFSLNQGSMKVDLIVEEMENHNTKVTVRNLLVRKLFFQSGPDAEHREVDLLEQLSHIL